MELLRFILFFLFILGIAWFVTGGPNRESSQQPFLLPPIPNINLEGEHPSDTEDAQTPEGTEQQESPPKAELSVLSGTISFSRVTEAKNSIPEEEYLVIEASRSNSESIAISGWEIRSLVTGKKGAIGNGAQLPRPNTLSTLQPIFLEPGDRAFVITGRSPKGLSFRLNTCTGYFGQFQTFTPTLPEQCPSPGDEEPPSGLNGVSDTCLAYLDTLPRCEALTGPVPSSLANDPICQRWVSEKVSYDGCVELHKDDADFFKAEWRVYLGRDDELWKKERETIGLYDTNGNLVDSVSF